jgi:lysophospholipase L1-like esterase
LGRALQIGDLLERVPSDRCVESPQRVATFHVSKTSTAPTLPVLGTRRGSIVASLAIAAGFTILLVNPLTVWLVADWYYGHIVYPLVIDLYLALVIAAGILFLRSGQPLFFAVTLAAVALFLPALLGVELAIVNDGFRQGVPKGYLIENVHRPSLTLGWETIPNATGRHYSAGNFDVNYEFDERGRRRIPYSASAAVTLHAFGDSFGFGHGVANADAALNRLAARLGDTTGVRNYSVMGYGLEQMLARMTANADEIRPGDVVMFMPTASDIDRGLAGKQYVCTGYFRAIRDPAFGERRRFFPRLKGDRIESADLEAECSYVRDVLLRRSHMLFGILYNAMETRRVALELMPTARQVLQQAARVAEGRGARFVVLLVARPSECRKGRYDADWTGVGMPFISMLEYCPTDPALVESFHFPEDGHLSPAGNRWLADSLLDALRRRGYL